MTKLLSEKFGLYRIEVGEEDEEPLETNRFFWDIDYLDEDGSSFGCESDAQPYPTGLDALKVAMVRLAELFWQDIEHETETREGAGNGIRTHDILLGNFSLPVKSTDGEVQS